MKRLIYYIKNFIAILTLLFFISCEDEFNSFPTINYSPCEDSNVVLDPNIITDFECQANFSLDNVRDLISPQLLSEAAQDRTQSPVMSLASSSPRNTDLKAITVESGIKYQVGESFFRGRS